MAEMDQLAARIRDMATEAGFAVVGFAPAGEIALADRLQEWLDRGYDAGMAYMRRNLDKRCCPSRLVEGTASVICLAAAYSSADNSGSLVARHAQGRDYHRVLKACCIDLMDRIRQEQPSFAGRAFVDSAPVMERALAAMSGIGWIGRNGCLFVPGAGSYVMLCEIICNLPLPAGHPSENPCRGCGACVAACPTGALGEDGLVDARKCISYHTIENRGPIPPLLWDKFSARLFGCDACQEACPHNRGFSDGRLATAKRIEDQPISLADVLGWAYDDWDIATRGRVLRRASREMFLRNAAISAGNSGDASLVDPLRRLEATTDLAEVVRWAIGRLETGKHKRRPLE